MARLGTLLSLPFLIPFILSGCSQPQFANNPNDKIRGFIFDGPSKPPITAEMLDSMTELNAGWVAATPEAFTFHQDLSIKTFYDSGNWFSETLSGAIIIAKLARQSGMKTMIKPHISFLYDLSN